MNLQNLKSAIVMALCCSTSLAVAGEPLNDEQLSKLRKGIERPGTGVKVVSAETSVVPGLLEVQLSDGPVVYATDKGNFFIVGDLYSVGPNGYINLAEQRRDAQRAAKLATVAPEDMIIFAPESEPVTHVTVFFDDTCFYCQKLHKEVPQLNKNGVEVRYLAYPRGGLGSDAFRNLASAWCADDPLQAFNQLAEKQAVVANICDGNPIAAQYQLGQELGVRGTPAIVTETGQMIPGYQSAEDLLATLGLSGESSQ